MSKKYKVMYSPCGCCFQMLFPYLVNGPSEARTVFENVKKRFRLNQRDFEASYLEEVVNE